jgi:hypothetical protein
MNDPQPGSGLLGLPVSVWIALVLGVAGVFALSNNPFQDTRPAPTMVPLHHHSLDDGQTIEARLWEDPLSAVALVRSEDKHPPPYDLSKLKDRIQKDIGRANGKTLVLGVMVTGEPYTDDMETRRRIRYAVLAGLYRSGFVPVNPDHIGYVQTEPLESVGDGQASGKGMTTSPGDEASGEHDVAAFEWFKRDTADTGRSAERGESRGATDPTVHDHVLVLWLDQEALRDMPLRRLSTFLGAIAGDEHGLVDIAVLGPADSDGLHAMYDEVQKLRPTAASEAGEFRQINVYSSRATASDHSITTLPEETARLAKSIFERTNERIRFYQSVANDQDVEAAVVKELQRRGIDRPGKIALVAERDTLYARGMGGYFGGCRNPPRADPSQSLHDEDEHVACFTYLKGLDGLAPTRPTAASSSANSSSQQQSSASNQSAANSQPNGAVDEAIGPSQLDYLRRLAGTIAALRQSGTRIRAIGVVSSDVYDKLLVLQALHNALPGVLYFTFDLDARLVEPKNLRWTRQLVVGSALGLSLRPELQGDVPPFRDSYQTATFYSTLVAIHRFVSAGEAHAVQASRGAGQGGDPDSPGIFYHFDPDTRVQPGFQWTARPRIFEIGRSQEYDLTYQPSDESCNFDGPCHSIGANRESWLWSKHWAGAKGLLVGVVLALLGLAGAAIAVGIRGIVGLSRTHVIPGFGESRWNNELSSFLAAIFVIVVTAFAWPYLVESVLKGGMPAPLFGGANQWISSAVDAVSIILVVLLVVRGQRKLNDNSELVGREFGLKRTRSQLIGWHRELRRAVQTERKKAAKQPAVTDSEVRNRPWELPRWLVWFWFPLRALPRRSGIDFARGDVSQLEAIIAQYLYHGTARARLRRVLPVTLIVVLLLVVPLEEIPGVAHLGRSLDLVSFLSLVAMQFLIFWAADALLLSRSFILALKRDKPGWPSTTDTLGLPSKNADRWLDLRLVAARTRAVSALVWYPSLVIAVMAIAAFTIQFREFQFANNPIALAVGTFFVIGSAVALRTAAESLRSDVRRCFENERLTAPASPSDKQIKLLLGRISELREGAFAPYSEQPIVRAVLVPAATYGATIGLQYLHIGS